MYMTESRRTHGAGAADAAFRTAHREPRVALMLAGVGLPAPGIEAIHFADCVARWPAARLMANMVVYGIFWIEGRLSF